MDKAVQTKIDADYAAYNRLGIVDLAPIYRRKTSKDPEGVGKQAMITAIIGTLYSKKYIEEYNASHAQESEQPKEEKVMAGKKPVSKTTKPAKGVAPTAEEPEVESADGTITKGGVVLIKKSIENKLKKAKPEMDAIAEAGIAKATESLKNVKIAAVKVGIKVGDKIIEVKKKNPVVEEPEDEPEDEPADHIVKIQPNGTFKKVGREAGRRALEEAIAPPTKANPNHPCWCIASGCSNMVGTMISRCPKSCKGDGTTACVHPLCKKACPEAPEEAEDIIVLPEPVKKSAPVKKEAPVEKTPAKKAPAPGACPRCGKDAKGEEFCGKCRNAIRMMNDANRAKWITPEPEKKAPAKKKGVAPPTAKPKKVVATPKKPVKPVKKPVKTIIKKKK